MLTQSLTDVSVLAAADFSRLNSGRPLTRTEAEQLVDFIALKTAAGRAGAFVGQSVDDAIAAIVGESE